MNYKDCLDYLFKQLPIYQRIGKAAYKADLHNTLDLLKFLGNPEDRFKSVHVAGTNGKGSVSHMLASIMHESGLKTGLYTSPHLIDFRERIKINGQMIPEHDVVKFVNSHKDEVERISPSFFEWTVALAFSYFADNEVDIAIIETGLGGRLDSTNVINPELSIITNIGHDHMRFLGNRLQEIAMEKAGIIKPNTPVVIGDALPEIREVFDSRADEMDADIFVAEDATFPFYEMDLKGSYQLRNQKTVLCSIDRLKESGWNIPEKAIAEGFENIVSNTGLLGRWQQLSDNPRVILDMAHNKEGIIAMLESLKEQEFDDLHIVWGTVDDKNADEILELMPATANYYFCCPDVPRGLDVYKLLKIAQDLGLTGSAFDSVQDAVKNAKNNAAKNDLVFVGGSTFVVAEVV